MKQYAETKIITKYGNFNIRVYKDLPGHETVVLFTNNINNSSAVFVRIHSECFTGDLLKSLHCDCGKQLKKSLELINEYGGLVIYLRQEGRGIGLFEKIKTYELQKEGHDTFEANIILGHKPDERTYEMVKTILDDLNIKKIKLLTNNPSKVSEVAKLGIEVTERIPLIVRPNKYNKNYFETKKHKFQHCYHKNMNTYLYQFHADTTDQISQISNYIKNKITDPLLKIGVGISGNSSSLLDIEEISRINTIFENIRTLDNIIPILHFSFKNSKNPIEDLKLIKKIMPFVNRIQLNDLKCIDINFLRIACSLFIIDLPLSDEDFDIIHNNRIRSILKKNNSFILIDNSKGRGIKESKSSLMKKIDVLLKYWHNNITLCGGFGPGYLDIFFEIKNHYKINFSIDAESKLKSNGKIDVQKVKSYLNELLFFSNENSRGIVQTRDFLEKNRRSDWEKTIIQHKEFLIHPKVFHSGKFPSTAWYAEKVIDLTKNDTDFCEIGSGSGIVSCILGYHHKNIKILASDINPYAFENIVLNIKKIGLKNKMSVTISDVFDSIPKERKFDTILWLLPFGYLNPKLKISLEEMQVFDPGYQSIEKFFRDAKNYIKPNGKLLIGFSPDLGNSTLFNNLTKKYSIKIKVLQETKLLETEFVRFQLLEGKYY